MSTDTDKTFLPQNVLLFDEQNDNSPLANYIKCSKLLKFSLLTLYTDNK